MDILLVLLYLLRHNDWLVQHKHIKSYHISWCFSAHTISIPSIVIFVSLYFVCNPIIMLPQNELPDVCLFDLFFFFFCSSSSNNTSDSMNWEWSKHKKNTFFELNETSKQNDNNKIWYTISNCLVTIKAIILYGYKH